MSDPAESRESAVSADVDAERREAERLEELAARRRVLNVWSVLPGRFPWITAVVVIAAVAATVASALWPAETFAWLYASGTDLWRDRKWWGLLGCLFIHAGTMHLVLNLVWTWLLGRLLERELGAACYAGLFFATGLAGNLAELAWSGAPGVGLSGVVYGLIGFVMVNASRHPDFRRVLAGNLRMWALGWLVACFLFTHMGVLRVANFAHVGGLLSGMLIGLAAYPGRWKRAGVVGCVVLVLAAGAMLFWAPRPSG